MEPRSAESTEGGGVPEPSPRPSSPGEGRRAADACPYPRPFPEEFDDCPVYQGRLFVGLDLQYRPLRPSRTCRFLTVGEVRDFPGTFYGRCALGDAEARSNLLSRLDRERLAQLQTLRLELANLARAFVEELWQLKGEQLRVENLGQPGDSHASEQALQSLSNRFLRQTEAFLEEHDDSLRELGLPVDAVLQATAIALDAFVQQRTAEETQFELPDEVLERFPSDVRELVRPVSSLPRAGT